MPFYPPSSSDKANSGSALHILDRLQAQLQELRKRCCCGDAFGITELDPPVAAPGEKDPKVLFNLTTGSLFYWDGDSWELFASGGSAYVEVTYAEAETLKNTNGIVPGTLYKITDRGDAGIFIQGLATNNFSQTGHRLMLIPTTYEAGATVTYNATPYTSYGMFSRYTAEQFGGYLTNSFVIYNAHFWRFEGAFYAGETIQDPNALQTFIGSGFGDWVRIEKNDPAASLLYVPQLFDIKYDFNNDWIYEQSDRFNNVVGISHTLFTVMMNNGLLVENPINYTDWGLAIYKETEDSVYSTISNNKLPLGFYNNTNDPFSQDYIMESNNCSHIIHNYAAGSGIFFRGNMSNSLVWNEAGYGGIRNNINFVGDLGFDSNYFVRGIYGNTSFLFYGNKVNSIDNNLNDSGGRVNKNIGDVISGNHLGEGNIDYNLVTTILNNEIEEGIEYNFGGVISGNTTNNKLEDNRCTRITDNILTGSLWQNVVGEISGNTCGAIFKNRCDEIKDNDSGIGSISGNINRGYINNNSAASGGPWDISNNTNNGNISGAWSANVNDPTVDK